jgi:hypothetical protein
MDCKCWYNRNEDGMDAYLIMCPMHRAAPDLLEALQDIAYWMYSGDHTATDILKRANEAIAKA